MRFIFVILVMLGLVGLSPAIAAEDTRPECDSCRFQIKSLDTQVRHFLNVSP
jgi:hypothetical protein